MRIKLFLIAFIIFFLIDLFWLGFIARDFYQAQIGFLLSSEVNWVAAIIFYILLTSGLVIFVIAPAIQKKKWRHAVLFGAFFSLIVYAGYDLTNLATLRDWPFIVTVVDIAWGMVLGTTVSFCTYSFYTKFFSESV